MSLRAFYDGLAPLYHLVYEDWEASVRRQGAALAAPIAERWGADARVVLDVAVGIGTQALGLLAHGFRVVGSDLSLAAVIRARPEADARGLRLPCLVADFRSLAARSESADVVLVADNSLPHLLSEAEIAAALAEYFRCARPGGGCLITMRDYGIPPPPGTREVHPFGERAWRGHRFHVRQVWTWRDRRYDLALEVTPLDAESGDSVPVLETSYFAITLEEVAELMRGAGFERVERVDGRFFQPVLMGTRPRAA